MREVVKYEAKDSTLFDTQWDCFCYERGISQEVADVVRIIHSEQLYLDCDTYDTVLKSLERLQQFGLKITT